MRRALPLAVLLLALAACSDPGSEPTAQPPGPSPDPSAAQPLAWQPVPGPTDVSVTTDGTWTLAFDEERARSTLTGPDGVVADPVGGRVSDALLGTSYAVVVHRARSEEDPSTAVVTDLATGATSILDASTAGAPTVNGGTWALDGDRLVHATRGPDDAYCVGEVDLAAGTSRVGWCAPARTGFNAAHLGAAGDTLLTFDDAQPSCRTVVALADDAVQPLEGVTPCTGFEGVLTDGGAVWSEVPDPDRIEAATLHARTGDSTVDLGAGTSGTLTTCGGSVWFVRDPQSDTDPARLMRWDGSELTVARESPPGRAFMAAPRCGGDAVLTVSSYSEGGDEQVSARVS